MIRLSFALVLLLGTVYSAVAQTPSENPVAPDPRIWLGMTPEAAYKDRGAPLEVYPLIIDDQRWQVVHFYGDHTYLFWSSNRVWQVRLDKQWAGTFLGFAMGTPRAEVEANLGEPVARGDTWSIWNLPYQTFPRRLRLVFIENLLADAYFYRSDL